MMKRDRIAFKKRESLEKKRGRKKETKLRRKTKAETIAAVIDDFKEKKKEAIEALRKAREEAEKVNRPLPKVRNYSPTPGSWMEKTLDYLQKNGESRAADIRREIGLDEHCAAYPYPDRSNFMLLSTIIPRLTSYGLVERTRRGFYKLTRPWLRQFDEIELNGKKLVLLSNLENIKPGKTPVYAALVNAEGTLRCLTYFKNRLALFHLADQSWQAFYGEDRLRRTAIEFDLIYK